MEDRIENVPVGDGMVANWHRVSTMAMGQHYGIPTYGLDVTESLDAAWWFATHRFEEDGGKARYVPHTWNAMPFLKWPVIYVFWTGTSVGYRISICQRRDQVGRELCLLREDAACLGIFVQMICLPSSSSRLKLASHRQSASSSFLHLRTILSTASC